MVDLLKIAFPVMGQRNLEDRKVKTSNRLVILSLLKFLLAGLANLPNLAHLLNTGT